MKGKFGHSAAMTVQDLISDVCASALKSNGTNALLHRETNRAVGRAQHSIIIEYYIICRVCRERGDLTISLHFPVHTYTHALSHNGTFCE